jgi:hypothetical protein
VRALELPATRQPVVEQGPGGQAAFSRPWYLYFDGVFRRLTGSGANPEAITVGVSPYSYTITDDGILMVTGGTVSDIDYGRNGVFTDTGFTAGTLTVFAGDVVRVTYTVLPTVTLVRR